jgi:hypothetical protein
MIVRPVRRKSCKVHPVTPDALSNLLFGRENDDMGFVPLMVKIQSLPANRGKERSKFTASGGRGTSWTRPTLYRAAGTVSRG